ncbi:LGFP repeat-containing protein [Corynebacterium vitaeruminis]|uniref:LGFP repeat-containing protein n=1 Tax=Corynebacterium vitaeruminis TaxID=38305 RepID=UPI0035E41FC3
MAATLASRHARGPCFTVFERGLIYWSPTTGAVKITGSMLAQWADDPEWWFDELGFPTSSMREEDGRWIQDFQHGAMYAATARPPWAACGLLTGRKNPQAMGSPVRYP